MPVHCHPVSPDFLIDRLNPLRQALVLLLYSRTILLPRAGDRQGLLLKLLVGYLDLLADALRGLFNQRVDNLSDAGIECKRHKQRGGSDRYYGYQYQDLHNRLPGLWLAAFLPTHLVRGYYHGRCRNDNRDHESSYY